MSMNVTINAILVMLMRIVLTPVVRITAHVRKDTLEKDIAYTIETSSFNLHINNFSWK